MSTQHFHLVSALEAEEMLGKKYFYRQRIYRLAEKNKILTLKRKGQTVFIENHILKVFLTELEDRVKEKFPEIDFKSIQIFYTEAGGVKKIVIDGLFGKGISVNTNEETEDDLIKKLDTIMEWVSLEEHQGNDIPEAEDDEKEIALPKQDEIEKSEDKLALAEVLPQEIFWIRVSEAEIEGIPVKSGILMSLPSIAQFIGIRTDAFVTWVSQTTFKPHILSANYRQFQNTQNRVIWKKGTSAGQTPFIPFELLPEVIVAFRQSGRTPGYPGKAELLYDLSKSTLSAVGLAISGNKGKAADALADIGQSLGLNVADQIIGIFKQYELRDFQVATNRQFASKVKSLGEDYAITTGRLTLGITSRTAAAWKAFGASRNLPSKLRQSSREVMRQLSKSDGVGMAFGERHYIKDPDLEGAVQTGKQGKEFYKRLKEVGLLDDDNK